MRYSFFLLFSGLSITAFSQQQQQQFSNVFLANNSNPVIQIAQTNLFNANDDKNTGNQMSQQSNFDENNNADITDDGLSNVRQSSSSANNIDLGLSFKLSSRSSSSSSSTSKSKHQKHSFSKKLKKFERNFYGKMGAHKKSKHLVDVCFNWR